MATTQTDQKRQSIGNRVATPKLVPQGPGDLDSALGKAIGARVRLTTANPSSTVEGTLFTACRITNIVAINTTSSSSSSSDPTTQPCDFHLIPISRIQKFDIVSLASSASASFDNATPSISKVDVRAVKNREEGAVRKLKEAEARRGKGVSKEAQDIFDALARMYPARWHGTDMIVSDSVIIRSPYRKEDCSAPKNQEGALERIKAQVENVRQRIADRAAKGVSTGPAPGAPRKGG